MADYPNKIFKPRSKESNSEAKSVDPFEKLKSAGARGRFGKRTEYGEQMYGERSYGEEEIECAENEYGQKFYGDNEYGSDNQIAGIYQQRRERESYLGPGDKETGKPHTVLKPNYTPQNPQTVPQQANRQKYADSIIAWQALTPEQKENEHKKASKLAKRGYDLFRSVYLLTH